MMNHIVVARRPVLHANSLAHPQPPFFRSLLELPTTSLCGVAGTPAAVPPNATHGLGKALPVSAPRLSLAGPPLGGYTHFMAGWLCRPVNAGSSRRMCCNAVVLS
jgi:hypothetical protein